MSSVSRLFCESFRSLSSWATAVLSALTWAAAFSLTFVSASARASTLLTYRKCAPLFMRPRAIVPISFIFSLLYGSYLAVTFVFRPCHTRIYEKSLDGGCPSAKKCWESRDSCPKTSLGRYRGTILVQNLRWEGIAARFLSHNFAGKKFTRVSRPKSSLGKNLRAFLAPPEWRGRRFP